mmetsp:Transcript_24573/g.46401  ORF Transcript_24573/g.46401 Transcript_24573/m.46401 type:complete len:465 (-) Transcript_24573:74-1468(-)
MAVDFRDFPHLPQRGCRFSAPLRELNVRLRLANAAWWRLPQLDVEQQAFCHRGFEGPVSEFLQRTRREVLEARDLYPTSSHNGFDAFLAALGRALEGAEDVTLVVRDASGLSYFEDVAEVEYFERSVREDWALGVECPRPLLQFNSAEGVAKLVQRSHRIVALTGAGISVESGITPFRVPSKGEGTAIWAEFDAKRMTVGNFNNDASVRETAWQIDRKLLAEMSRAAPNAAHRFFGQLHARGKLKGIITQNIDSLHQKGGVPQELVNELHGHLRGFVCSDFRTRLNPTPIGSGACDYACNATDCSDAAVPSCPKCGAPLRAETVMFEQALPDGAVEDARDMVRGCDLLFVIGSTLLVQPANELPAEALRRGLPVVMVNLDETRYDEHVSSLINDPAGKFMAQVMQILGDGDWIAAGGEEELVHLAAKSEYVEPMSATQPPTCGHESYSESESESVLYGDDDLAL